MLKTSRELMSSLHLSGYLEMNYQFKTNKNNHLYGLRLEGNITFSPLPPPPPLEPRFPFPPLK